MLFTLRETRKMFGLTRRMMQYYAEIDLLRPIRKADGNQEWYYDDASIAKLTMIQMYKEAGMDLREIREAFTEDTGIHRKLLSGHLDSLNMHRKKADAMFAVAEKLDEICGEDGKNVPDELGQSGYFPRICCLIQRISREKGGIPAEIISSDYDLPVNDSPGNVSQGKDLRKDHTPGDNSSECALLKDMEEVKEKFCRCFAVPRDEYAEAVTYFLAEYYTVPKVKKYVDLLLGEELKSEDVYAFLRRVRNR
ncbi:MAG: MerR family transcriptional regulator [Eubacterium sp.]|nr:MerR family transcriptional regulator [Eubacterium sp.]